MVFNLVLGPLPSWLNHAPLYSFYYGVKWVSFHARFTIHHILILVLLFMANKISILNTSLFRTSRRYFKNIIKCNVKLNSNLCFLIKVNSIIGSVTCKRKILRLGVRDIHIHKMRYVPLLKNSFRRAAGASFINMQFVSILFVEL